MEAIIILEAYRETTVGILCSSPCQHAVSHRADFLKKSAQLEYTPFGFCSMIFCRLAIAKGTPGCSGLKRVCRAHREDP